jgi:hypothetical protein
MATVLVSIALLIGVVILLALRILLVPGGEFRGTCASNNPYLRNELGGCGACGKQDPEEIDGCEHRAAHPGFLFKHLLHRLRNARQPRQSNS